MTDADLVSPMISLPVQEVEGAKAFLAGTAMSNDRLLYGFAFCNYPFGSLQHDNWVAGYAGKAFSIVEEFEDVAH